MPPIDRCPTPIFRESTGESNTASALEPLSVLDVILDRGPPANQRLNLEGLPQHAEGMKRLFGAWFLGRLIYSLAMQRSARL